MRVFPVYQIRDISELRDKQPFVKRVITDDIKKTLDKCEAPIGIVGLYRAGKTEAVRPLLGGSDVYIEAWTEQGREEIDKTKQLIQISGAKELPNLIIIDEVSGYIADPNVSCERTLKLISCAREKGIKVLIIYHDVFDVPQRARENFGITEEITIPVTFTEAELRQISDGLFPRLGIKLDEEALEIFMEYRFTLQNLFIMRGIGRYIHHRYFYSDDIEKPLPLPDTIVIDHNTMRSILMNEVYPYVDEILEIVRNCSEDRKMDLVRLSKGEKIPYERFERLVQLGLVESDGRLLEPMRDFVDKGYIFRY